MSHSVFSIVLLGEVDFKMLPNDIDLHVTNMENKRRLLDVAGKLHALVTDKVRKRTFFFFFFFFASH